MKKRKLNLREKMLLFFALLVAFGTGYFILRYKPALFAIKVLEEETQQLASTLKTQRIPRPPSRDSAQIDRDLKDMEAQLDQRLKQLKTLEARYVDMHSARSLQGLMVEISTIASASHIVIRETLPYTAGTSGVKSSRSPVSQNLIALFSVQGTYPRPLNTLRLEGTYLNLRRFINGMMRLNHQVVVLQFGFNTMTDRSPGRRKSLLSAEIVVAL